MRKRKPRWTPGMRKVPKSDLEISNYLIQGHINRIIDEVNRHDAEMKSLAHVSKLFLLKQQTGEDDGMPDFSQVFMQGQN